MKRKQEQEIPEQDNTIKKQKRFVVSEAEPRFCGANPLKTGAASVNAARFLSTKEGGVGRGNVVSTPDLHITQAEVRERVFLIWYRLNRSDTQAAKEAKSQGFSASRQTIGEWKRKYNWQDRADSLDLKKLEREEKAHSARDKLLEDLYRRKEEYEAFFASLEVGKVDNQATYAYSQICGKIEALTSAVEEKERVKGEKNGRTFKVEFVNPDDEK